MLSILIASVVFFLQAKQYGNLFSFQRTFMFFPFFMIGYVRKQSGLSPIPNLSLRYKWTVAIMALTCISLCWCYSCRVLHVLEFGNTNVWYMAELFNMSVSHLILLRMLVVVGSLVVSTAVLLFIRLPYVICLYGSKTLAYFVMQGIFAHILASYFRPNLTQALFISVLILIFTTIMIRHIDPQIITSPISKFIKWKN